MKGSLLFANQGIHKVNYKFIMSMYIYCQFLRPHSRGCLHNISYHSSTCIKHSHFSISSVLQQSEYSFQCMLLSYSLHIYYYYTHTLWYSLSQVTFIAILSGQLHNLRLLHLIPTVSILYLLYAIPDNLCTLLPLLLPFILFVFLKELISANFTEPQE